MCIFIKDDDEQCGMSNHDGLWCRHHEDSRQAQAFAQAASAAQSDSSSKTMDTTCGEKESAVEYYTGSENNLVDPLKYCNLDGWNSRSESYVYVLAIKRLEDGEVFWYVGETTNIYERMRKHKYPSGSMSIPTTDGKIVSTHAVEDARFALLGLEKIIDVSKMCDSKRRNKEREIAFETAIKKNSTNVLGGHK